MVKVNIYLSTLARLKADNNDYDTNFSEGNLAPFSKIVEKDSYKVSYGFSYGSTPKTSTFTCKISAEPYYIKAFEAYEAIKVTKVKNGTEEPVFYGCKPTIKRTYETSDWWSETITFNDYSQDLSDITFHAVEKVTHKDGTTEDVDWNWTINENNGYKVCDPSDTTHSLVHYLFEEYANKDRQGLAFTLHCDFANRNPVTIFSVNGKDKVLTVWQNLLKMQGLAYYVKGLDIYILDMLADEPTSATVIDCIECNATKNEKPYIEHTIPAIRVPKLEKYKDESLYNSGKVTVGFNKWYPSKTIAGVAEPSFTFSRDNMEVARYYNVKWEYTAPTCTPAWTIVLYLYNGNEKIQKSTDILNPSCSGELSGDKLKFAVRSIGMTNLYFRLKMTGDVDVLNYNKILMPATEDYSGSEEKATYVFNDTEGDRYMNALMYSKEMEKTTFSFYSPQELDLNSVCVLSNITETSQYLRITDKQDNLDDFEGYTYSATVYNGTEVTIDSKYLPASIDAPNVSQDFNFSVSRSLIACDSEGTPLDSTAVTARISLLKYFSVPHLFLDGTEVELTQDTETVEEETVYLDSWHYDISVTSISNGSTLKATLGDMEKTITFEKVNNGATGATGEKGDQGYSIVASVSRGSDGENDFWWDNIGTIGHEGSFSNTSSIRNGCRIGDLFTIVGPSTSGRAYTVTYRSTTDSGNLTGVCISCAYAEKGAKGDTGEAGQAGTPALVCKLSCNKTTVTKNLRSSGYEDYTFTVDIQGYTDTPKLSIGETEVTLEGNIYVHRVYYKDAQPITATLTCGTVTDTLSLSVVDETGSPQYFGVIDIPTDNTSYIIGDSLVNGNYVYIFNGLDWQKVNESTLTDLQKSHALSSAMNDILSSITADTITSSDYAYFKTLITDTISADYISSKEITVTKSIQSATITNEKGFKLSSDGTITANKATLNNVQISGGEFSADSLKTQNADENGSFYAITGTPSESCSASTEVKSVADDGTITTVGTLTKTQDNYYKTKDFAQWCLDNIPVSNAGFTQLEGTINGYNAYAMRRNEFAWSDQGRIHTNTGWPAQTRTAEGSFDFGNYYGEIRAFVGVPAADDTYSYNACGYSISIDGNVVASGTKYIKAVSTGTWTTSNGVYIDLTSLLGGRLTGSHSFKISASKPRTYPTSNTSAYSPDFTALVVLQTSLTLTKDNCLKNITSNAILLMLYQSDSSIVFNGGTASNPLKVISINSDISDTTTMTSLGSLTPNDTTYSTMAVNLLYNGVACVCGGNQTGWTVTRYFKFLGLYNCGAGSWATPTIANTISVKVKNAFIDGTQQNQELTLQYNGTNLTLTSDDKTIAYQLDTGDYYTSLPSICMTAIASSKGAYVSSLYPMQAGESDIGSASQPFDQVYANSYRNMFPVGAIYMSVNPTSPASLFGGLWEEIHDRFLVGAGNLYAVNEQDGEASHVLTESEMPTHQGHLAGNGIATWYPDKTEDYLMLSTKAISTGLVSKWTYRMWTVTNGNELGIKTITKGNSSAHNNLPPYMAVYMWKRLPDSTT